MSKISEYKNVSSLLDTNEAFIYDDQYCLHMQLKPLNNLMLIRTASIWNSYIESFLQIGRQSASAESVVGGR